MKLQELVCSPEIAELFYINAFHDSLNKLISLIEKNLLDMKDLLPTNDTGELNGMD